MVGRTGNIGVPTMLTPPRLAVYVVGLMALAAASASAQPQPEEPGPKPVISEVSVPKEARPGDSFTVTWRVQAESGIGFTTNKEGLPTLGTWMVIGGPSGWVTWCEFPAFARPESGTDEDGVYSASCTVPDVLPNGEYSVQIAAIDGLGVRAETDFQPFTVVGAADDRSPPVVSDVAVSPENPEPGDTLTISWRARDESGVSSIMPWAEGPNGRLVDEQCRFWMDSFAGELVEGTPRDGIYRIELDLSEEAAVGKYRIWFSIADVIGNRDTTYSLEPAVTFEVTDAGIAADP